MEPVPLQQGFSSRLLTADLEREPRSPFLILVVLGIGIALVVGALWWKGWIPTRIKQHDAEMSALQEQNRKLADTLAQMSVKPPTGAAGAPQNGVVSQQPKTAQEEHPAQSGHSELPVRRPSQSEETARGLCSAANAGSGPWTAAFFYAAKGFSVRSPPRDRSAISYARSIAEHGRQCGWQPAGSEYQCLPCTVYPWGIPAARPGGGSGASGNESGYDFARGCAAGGRRTEVADAICRE